MLPQVPIREMVASISVAQPTGAIIVAGTWARVRAGTYKNDLAYVESVNMAERAVATVKLVPRLDFELLASREKIPFGQRAKRPRPAAKLFTADEARDAGVADLEDRGDHILVNGTHKFADGYLLKAMAFSSLRPEPKPGFEELARFQGNLLAADQSAAGGSSAVALEALVSSAMRGADAPTAFNVGDAVVVISGELVRGTPRAARGGLGARTRASQPPARGPGLPAAAGWARLRVILFFKSALVLASLPHALTPPSTGGAGQHGGHSDQRVGRRAGLGETPSLPGAGWQP